MTNKICANYCIIQAKKNKRGKPRNGRSRTSDQNNNENSRGDLSSEDVPSVEAAE